MITKDEFLDWRLHPVTVKLLEAIKAGRNMQLDALVRLRGEVGDFYRGGLQQLDEIEHIVRTGEDINETSGILYSS